MPLKVYFDENGKIFYTEPLNVGVFFVPDGAELDYIDLSDPEKPVAITKPVGGFSEPEGSTDE